MARILTLATKIPLRDFAQKYLFDPMGLEIMGWPRDAQGYYEGSQIFLTSRDLAKFGQLFLERGVYHGKKILAPEWVTTITSPKIKGSKGNGEYGYFWWINPEATPANYYAWGYGGQYI